MNQELKRPSITAIIIAKNEEEMIANCLETLRWCDEILVIDSGSEDATASLAENLGARVINFKSPHFDALREEGLKRSKTDWVLYIDADERITPTLAQEIQVHLETTHAKAMTFRRHNIMYGKELVGGGWQGEQLTRIFERASLKGWQGNIHESPVFEGETIILHTPLIHLTHRSARDGLLKSANWTLIEAKLLHQADTPTVTIGTLIRKPFMEFLRRLVFKKGYQDGIEGWIEAITQAFNKFLIYAQLWELQQKPSLKEKYQVYEQKIAREWAEFEK